MDDGIYKKLARHLDNLPAGFPPTESGVELRILRRLFSPEEARLACHLTLIPEEAPVIARRAKIPLAETSRRLEEMALKGLIFNMTPNGRPTLYMASQYVIGIWEEIEMPLGAVEFLKSRGGFVHSKQGKKWQSRFLIEML